MSRRRELGVPLASGVLAVGAALTAHLLPGPEAAAAAGAWTDTATVGGTSVSTATVAAPATFSCGTVQALSVSFTWSAVPGATSYTLHHGLLGVQTTTTTSTSATITALVNAGTAWVTTNQAVGSTTWSSGPSPTRTYTVAAVSLCT